ncbi:hypothetical protein [Sciscionella sediminilitoris]|uniref:hypothetical protein n=1 Tax=Sciscionella sediminilitoris TaxID=1445613 RepID=UPI0004DFAD8D|nr:hypothetical protein [Sciscionella sp. SE31]
MTWLAVAVAGPGLAALLVVLAWLVLAARVRRATQRARRTHQRAEHDPNSPTTAWATSRHEPDPRPATYRLNTDPDGPRRDRLKPVAYPIQNPKDPKR